jgi:uncharacterized protein (TIGR02001 family)
MIKKIATLVGLLAFCAGTAHAQEEKPTWKAPFGGTFTAGFTFATDYSYRGISQTQRQVAFQPSFTYETATVGEAVQASVYAGAWASNVYFPNTNAAAEIDIIGGFRFKALEGKLTADVGYIRYTYPGSTSTLMLDFSEFGLVLGYDFGPVQLSGAIRYSPEFFAASGNAWYKWAQATVPLPFINFNLFNEPVTAKLFGTIASQYVQRNVNYGIPYNDYWDWSLGATVNVYGVDLTVAYIGTNIDVQGCLNTYNCEDRVVFSISKTF